MPPGAEQLTAGLWRLELPSRTLPPFSSTNCYLIRAGDRALLIDPGSDRPQEIEAAIAQTGARRVAAVLLTHTHRDHHDGLAGVLRRHPQAELRVHPLEAERMADFAVRPLPGGSRLDLGSGSLLVLHTPGHSPGGVSLLLPERRVALVGDLLAGSGSSWVGRPDGDVGDYLASIDLLLGHEPELLGPGHGPPLSGGPAHLRRAREHRLAREAQIVSHLGEQPIELAALRQAVYGHLDSALHPAAHGSLLAHLDKLADEGRAELLQHGETVLARGVPAQPRSD